MYLNYKCNINFNLYQIGDSTADFLRKLLDKEPENRFRAVQALEDEALLHMEMDETDSSINILSAKIKLAPMM